MVGRSELADDACRIAGGDDAGRNLTGDDGTGADHRVGADLRPLEDLHPHADEDVVTDLDRGHLRPPVVTPQRVKVVEVAVEDLDVGAEETIGADLDPGALA